MSATITLATTTLRTSCGIGDTQLNVASLTGINQFSNGNTNGIFLYITGGNPGEHGELVQVSGIAVINGSDNWINVNRGVGSTAVRRHSSGATVYIGQPDWFFLEDPQGAPPIAVYVQPHINVITGDIWVPQGDESDLNPTPAVRWWARQNGTPGVGDLGIRTVATPTPVIGT
jgi:hypothetical protein